MQYPSSLKGQEGGWDRWWLVRGRLSPVLRVKGPTCVLSTVFTDCRKIIDFFSVFLFPLLRSGPMKRLPGSCGIAIRNNYTCILNKTQPLPCGIVTYTWGSRTCLLTIYACTLPEASCLHLCCRHNPHFSKHSPSSVSFKFSSSSSLSI